MNIIFLINCSICEKEGEISFLQYKKDICKKCEYTNYNSFITLFPSISRKDRTETNEVKDINCYISYYNSIFHESFNNLLYYILDNLSWKRYNKRENFNYGVGSYEVKFRDKVIKRINIPWEKCPILIFIRDKISCLLQEKYNLKVEFKYVVIQRYGAPHIMIKKHRDKEIKENIICGLSVGDVRNLNIERYEKKYTFKLEHGSLYILHSPTNKYYTHEIERGNKDSKLARYSLTLRK
jgi:hypothetical protein